MEYAGVVPSVKPPSPSEREAFRKVENAAILLAYWNVVVGSRIPCRAYG